MTNPKALPFYYKDTNNQFILGGSFPLVKPLSYYAQNANIPITGNEYVERLAPNMIGYENSISRIIATCAVNHSDMIQSGGVIRLGKADSDAELRLARTTYGSKYWYTVRLYIQETSVAIVGYIKVGTTQNPEDTTWYYRHSYFVDESAWEQQVGRTGSNNSKIGIAWESGTSVTNIANDSVVSYPGSTTSINNSRGFTTFQQQVGYGGINEIDYYTAGEGYVRVRYNQDNGDGLPPDSDYGQDTNALWEIVKNYITGGGYEPTPESEDDYQEDSTFDAITDNGFSDDPTSPYYAPGATGSGLLQIIVPERSDIQYLANRLWSQTVSSWFNNLIANPADAIVGLWSYPFAISKGASKEDVFVGIRALGEADAGGGTRYQMYHAKSQYQSIDIAGISIPWQWNSERDVYDTKVTIFLPFIGYRELDPGIVMGSTVALRYNVDLLSGVCIAEVIVTLSAERSPTGEQVTGTFYVFEGHCGNRIPLISNDTGENIIAAAQSAVGATTAALAGNPAGAVISAISGIKNAAKQNISYNGQMSTAGGFLASSLTPYILIERPLPKFTDDMPGFMGRPLHAIKNLSDLTGFTSCEEVHTDSIPCTEEEHAMIEQMLKEGVIL